MPQSSGAINIRLGLAVPNNSYFYKSNGFAMGQRTRRIIQISVMLCAIAILAQSCTVFKDCGCSNDINRTYKPPRNLR